MRRLPVLCVVACIACCGIFALRVSPIGPLASWGAHRALGTLSGLVALPARAQEVLEFKPVPAESVAKMDERRASRHRSTTSTTPATTPPVPPAAPGTPNAPEAPDTPNTMITSRSGNIMRVGNDIHIESEQTVIGDVLAVGGDVTVDGHVEGDVVSMGGDVYLNATARVDGDVVCMGGQLHEEDGASVGGQRVTAAGGRHGRLGRFGHMAEDHVEHHVPNATGALVWLLVSLAIAWGFATIAPGRTAAAVGTVQREPGMATLAGFLALMLAVPSLLVVCVLAVLLCITVIGIPLAIAALFGMLAFMALVWIWGYVIGLATVGEFFQKRRGMATPAIVKSALWGAGLVGGALVVAKLLHVLPFFGGFGTLIAVLTWIMTGVMTMIGSGAWLRNEIEAGTFLRWWRGRNRFMPGGAPPMQPATAPAGATPPMAPSVTWQAPASGAVAPAPASPWSVPGVTSPPPAPPEPPSEPPPVSG